MSCKQCKPAFPSRFFFFVCFFLFLGFAQRPEVVVVGVFWLLATKVKRAPCYFAGVSKLS